MKDRYLFKAKTCNGEWVSGFLHCKENKWYISNKAGAPFAFEVRPGTICQCTGMTDENGKLIWENDIVHKPFYTDYDAYANSEAYTGRIQFEDNAWCVEIIKEDECRYVYLPIIELLTYTKDTEYFKVIGNIFDNPDLLEMGGVRYAKSCNRNSK